LADHFANLHTQGCLENAPELLEADHTTVSLYCDLRRHS
jgi:hypothetical protein